MISAVRDGYKMTKTAIPLMAEDITHFARAMARQMDKQTETPSHLSMMNMVSRAAGFQNYQHLRAAHQAGARLENSEAPENVDYRLVERTLNLFDGAGRLKQWPKRRSVQELSLWGLWARLPSGVLMQEPEVNALLLKEHLFEDTAMLRRSWVGLGLVTRNRDGSDYQRCEVRPPAEARALIRYLDARRETRSE